MSPLNSWSASRTTGQMFPLNIDCWSGGLVAVDADSPGDSRVAYTLTRRPGLSVNWTRSWFRALSRTCESCEE